MSRPRPAADEVALEVLVTVACPRCWQETTLTVEPAYGHQVLVEDCPVCCTPMEVAIESEDGEVQRVEVLSS